MKLSEMFIGQIVMDSSPNRESVRGNIIPRVGHIVDLSMEYDAWLLPRCPNSTTLRVFPVVKFVGEEVPRKVAPHQIEPYKE